MSDLKPKGIIVEIAGKEHELLFTINAIETIQEKCNAALVDTIRSVARVADGKLKKPYLLDLCTVIAVLCQKEGTNYTAADFDGAIKPTEYPKIALKILEAYGISLPEPDEEDEDTKEDEDPNQETGL